MNLENSSNKGMICDLGRIKVKVLKLILQIPPFLVHKKKNSTHTYATPEHSVHDFAYPKRSNMDLGGRGQHDMFFENNGQHEVSLVHEFNQRHLPIPILSPIEKAIKLEVLDFHGKISSVIFLSSFPPPEVSSHGIISPLVRKFSSLLSCLRDQPTRSRVHKVNWRTCRGELVN